MLKKPCTRKATAGACHTRQGNVPHLADVPEAAAEKAQFHQQYHITHVPMWRQLSQMVCFGTYSIASQWKRQCKTLKKNFYKPALLLTVSYVSLGK